MNKRGKVWSIIGLQWGDEGKGKLIDYLISLFGFRVALRSNGGNNAGHSVYLDDELIHLHFIPSSIVHPEGIALMAAGELLEPFAFLREKLYLEKVHDINTEGRIFLDPRMSLILLYHRIEDMARELIRKRKTGGEIGTTANGIGPTYADLANRTGIRLQQLLGDPDTFGRMFRERTEEKLKFFFKVLGLKVDKKRKINDLETILEGLQKKDLQRNDEIIRVGAVDPEIFNYPRYLNEPYGLKIEALAQDYLDAASHLKGLNCVQDIALKVNQLRSAGKNILLEGGQGALLDVVFGTYPFVTSSHPLAGGACVGTSVGPTFIDKVIGVAKLFFTRVGGGPFPTEDPELGEKIRGTLDQPGAEFGTTTKRPRRVGWFDAVATRTAIFWSHVNQLFLTKLDFLDQLEEIKICTHYLLDGERLDFLPTDPKDLEKVEPVYEVMAGWRKPTTDIRKWSDLPANAQQYCKRVLELCQLPFKGAQPVTFHSIGVGPNRDQFIPINT